MVDIVFFIIAMCSVGSLLILCAIFLSKDFLDWGIKKTNPEWWKEYSKHLSEFYKLKYGSKKWGDNDAHIRV